VREHAFSRALPPAARSAAGGRALTQGPDDLRLLRRLLAGRAPVSDRFGSLEQGTVFVVALLLTWGNFSRVHYHAALDVVTVHEVRERTLALYDADRIVTFFSPDRLGEGFEAEPWDADRAAAHGDAWFAGLMARGPLPGEGGAFMLPPLSRT